MVFLLGNFRRTVLFQGGQHRFWNFFFLIIVLGFIWSAKTPTDDGKHSISSVLSGPSSTESDDLLPKYPASALEVFTLLTGICGHPEALSLNNTNC